MLMNISVCPSTLEIVLYSKPVNCDLLVCAGVTCPNSFDQLRNASMQGGFSAVSRTSPPAASVYITSGTGPYVAFFYAIEVCVCFMLVCDGVSARC